MLSSRHELDKYDLGSVRSVFTGAAPLGKETIEGIRKLFPQWRVGQGYGTRVRELAGWEGRQAHSLLPQA